MIIVMIKTMNVNMDVAAENPGLKKSGEKLVIQGVGPYTASDSSAAVD